MGNTQKQIYFNCDNWEQCHDKWSEECPDSRLYEPWEWCRCSFSCDRYEEKKTATEKLRIACTAHDYAFTRGVVLNDKVVCEDTITTIWPVRGANCSITIREDDGVLFCDDFLTIPQIIAIAEIGRE